MNYSDKKTLTFEILFLSIFVAVVHNVAQAQRFYYAIPKLDMVMHFLGGLLIGLIVLKFFYTGKRSEYAHVHPLKILTITTILVFVVGLGWEFFEYGAGLTPLYKVATMDTLSDLAFDVAGAVAAVWWYFKKVWRVG